MTVPNEKTVYYFEGNGTQTRFTYGFTLPDDNDERLIVRIRNALTNRSFVLELDTDYSVEFTPGAPGGDVVLVSAPPLQTFVEVLRDSRYPQDIEDNDDYTRFQREDGDDLRANVTMELRDRINLNERILSGEEGGGAPPPETSPIVPRPQDPNTYLESEPIDQVWVEKRLVVLRPQASEANYTLFANADGTTTWVDDRPQASEANYTLYANADGSTTWTDDLLHDALGFVQNTTGWRYTDGNTVRDLSLDFTTGDHTGITLSIDDDALPPSPVLGVQVAGNRVTLSPVENTGGIQMINPAAGRILKALDDNTITPTPFFEFELQGLPTLYAQQLLTSTEIVFYKDDSNFVTMTAENGAQYRLSWDISSEADTGTTLELIKDGDGLFRIIDRPPVPSELFHVNPDGGTPGNVPKFLGHQEVEPTKFVEDSALTNVGRDGPLRLTNLVLENVREKQRSDKIKGASIDSGSLVLDVTESNIFFVIFDQDITNLTVSNAVDGSSFLLILETLDSALNNIAWTSEHKFQHGVAWQSDAFSGEVDMLSFMRRGGNWYVDPVAGTMEYAPSHVIGVNTDLGGNVKTISGDGTVVLATGESRITPDGRLQNFVLENVREKQRSEIISISSVVSGVVDIDLAVARYWEVDMIESVTGINFVGDFDRASGQNLYVKFNETDDGFTYEFGTDFWYENGLRPEVSINGRFKGFIFSWWPVYQKWLALRYN